MTLDNIYTHNLIKKSELKTFKRIDSYKIMKNAADQCFKFIIKNIKFKKSLVIIGPGNNGGDGALIAKKLLKNKKNVTVYAPLKIGKSKNSKKALENLGLNNVKNKILKIEDYDLVIDCIFGVGLNRPLPTKINNLINNINKSKSKVISIDIPTGVNTDTGYINKAAIKAELTLTLHRLKPGLTLLPGKEYAGKIHVLDINLSNIDNESKIKIITKPILKKIFISDHKYSRGVSSIIASSNLIGASKLAALAASQSSLRSGCGAVRIFIKKGEEKYFKQHILEEMIVLYKDEKHLFDLINKTKIDSIIYGCGINISEKNARILNFLLDQKINLVLDASIFGIIKKNKSLFFKKLKNRKAETILTPHEGEFKKIFIKSNDKIKDSITASKRTNSIILYKGNDTVIASPSNEIFINYYSSPFLATAGSGDVLAGIIGGFLAQKYKAIEAARIACYIHSQCAIKINKVLIASDLIKEIPNIIKKLKRNN